MTDVTLTLDKVLRIVESCVTPEQYTVALNVVKQFQNLIGLDSMYEVTPTGSVIFSNLGVKVEQLKAICQQALMVGEDFGDCNSY